MLASVGMDLKRASEDIETGASKEGKTEENWLKRTKIKFKTGGVSENEYGEDEKKRKNCEREI